MFQVPLNLSTDKYKTAIELVVELVRVADAYDSLKMLTMPIENHLARFYQSSVAKDLEDNYQQLLHIAMKLQTTRLFRGVICRAIPSEHYSEFHVLQRRDHYRREDSRHRET